MVCSIFFFFFNKNSYIIYERHFRKNFHETNVHILCFQATPCSPHIIHGNNHKLKLNPDWMIFTVWTPPPHPPSPLFIGGLGFLKIHRRGDQYFLVKMEPGWWWGGGGSPYRGGEVFIMYGFCRSKAVYSARISFRMFIFLLTLFET